MQTGLFIRGGWAGSTDPRFGQNYTGLPSQRWCGSFYFRFPISDRHSAYEWAMALADRHPYHPQLAVLFGDVKAPTVAGMKARERAVEKLSDQTNAIYRELKVEFKGGRLDPLRREWCADHPGMLDFTRCTFGLDQVLPLVQRRGDTGRLIRKLVAVGERAPKHQHAPADTAAEPDSHSPERQSRKRGPRPCKRTATAAAMRRQIDERTMTPEELADRKETAMAAEYCVSRDTARNARKLVLSELRVEKLRQIPTIDK